VFVAITYGRVMLHSASPWSRIHDTSFSSKLMSETKKLEYFTLESLVFYSTLAYLAHLYVTSKMKCCEYGP
jgi:hypothetical protein